MHSLFPEELKLFFWVKVLLPQHLKASLTQPSKSDTKDSVPAPTPGYFKGITDIIRKLK